MIKAEEISGYRKKYHIRLAQGDKVRSAEVTFPYEVIERKARELGLTVPEFLEQYQVVAQYDNFDGVHYHFEEIPNEKSPSGDGL